MFLLRSPRQESPFGRSFTWMGSILRQESWIVVAAGRSDCCSYRKIKMIILQVISKKKLSISDLSTLKSEFFFNGTAFSLSSMITVLKNFFGSDVSLLQI